MSSTNAQERILNATFEDFATSLLPLYSGPQVTIRIGSASYEYRLPKALLCKQSPYFAATFEGPFREGEEQSTTLEEIDGVVSTQSFQMLVQWVCLGRIVFGESAPEDAITMAIEFARLADMCRITGMESLMAERIKAIILANPAPEDSHFEKYRAPDTNTHCLTSQNIISAVLLPEGHPVRAILAAAAVEGYLRQDNCKFLRETSEVVGFAVDLLKAVKATIKSTYGSTFKDPISEVRLGLDTK